VDTFEGEITDPQSLHKYAYVHGDPIQGIDPTGLSLSSLNVNISLRVGLAAIGGSVAIFAGYGYWSQASPAGQNFHGRHVHPAAWWAWIFGQDEIRKFRQAEFQTIAAAGTYSQADLGRIFDDYEYIYPRVTSRKCDCAMDELISQFGSMMEAKPGIRSGIKFQYAALYLQPSASNPNPEDDNFLILVPTKFANETDSFGDPAWYDSDEKRNILLFYVGSAPLIPVGKLYEVVTPNSRWGPMQQLLVTDDESF
jgi:hypothetical protein